MAPTTPPIRAPTMRDWFGAIAAKFAEDRVPGVPGVPGVPSLREPQNPAVSDTRELEHAETHPVFQVFRTVSRPGSTNASTLIREHREHRPALKGVPAESLE